MGRFFLWGGVLHHMAYRILVPQSGIEPRSPAEETQSPNHWIAREFPKLYFREFQTYLKESESEVAQSCLTLCNLVDCSLPGSSVHGIFQARVLEWVAISFSRGFSWTGDQTRVSRIAGRYFTIWATREVPTYLKEIKYNEVP